MGWVQALPDPRSSLESLLAPQEEQDQLPLCSAILAEPCHPPEPSGLNPHLGALSNPIWNFPSPLSCSIFCLTEVLCKAVPWDPKAPMASPPLPQHQELIQSCIQSLLPTFPSPGLTFSLPVFLVDKVS